MTQNAPIYPLWMAFPKSAAIFWCGLSFYDAIIDPCNRSVIPDARGKVSWWGRNHERSHVFVPALSLAIAVMGAFSYKETNNKFFMYGAIASALSGPLAMSLVYNAGKQIKEKASHIQQGGFLTKADEKKVESSFEEWNSKHKLTMLIPLIIAGLFVKAEYSELTGQK